MRSILHCAVASAFALSAGPAMADMDPLNRPALISPRVVHLAQLHATHAGKRLVSVGERGSILLSDDSGKTWRQAVTPVSVTLTNVAFADEQHGWAVGHSGVVLATSDGGLRWSKQLDGVQAADIELNAANAARGPNMPANAMRLASAERLVSDGPDKPFLGVHFFDAKTGLIVGAYGLAFMTHDGGRTWQSIIDRIDNPKGRHLYAVHENGSRIYLAGEQGALYCSDDQGKTFMALDSPSNATFFGMASAASGELVAYGLRGNAYRSSDKGIHWDKIAMSPISLTAGIRASDGSLVLADEAGRLLRSVDAGNTFHPLSVPRASAFSGVVQADDGAMVGAGANGPIRIDIGRTSLEEKK